MVEVSSVLLLLVLVASLAWFSGCFCWGAPGRFFGVRVVSGVTFGGHFRWYFWKVCVFFGEKVAPSILNDPTVVLLFFGAPRPPGEL